jgi:glutaredoxin-like protein
MTVQFYWRPGCPFCMTLRRGLRRRGIPVEPVNIWENPDAAARVRSVADGNETVPTVFIGDEALVNPTVAQVESLLLRAAPHLAAQLDTARGRRAWWKRPSATS